MQKLGEILGPLLKKLEPKPKKEGLTTGKGKNGQEKRTSTADKHKK